MKNVFLASFIGAIVLFIWGFISWTVVHLHNSTYKNLENGEAIADAIDNKLTRDGVYFYPGGVDAADNEAELKELEEKHKQGPLFTIIFLKQGRNILDPLVFVKGFVLFFMASFLVTFMLNYVSESIPSYLKRVLFVAGFGIFASLATYFNNWAWLYHPLLYVIIMSLDLIFGWLMAGVIIAAFIKPVKKYSYT